jgi:2-oxoglutarate dehydrogenase E2 component (dihydrolipoamide succinyltransferase)
MTIEVKVPALGESITEATVASWFKQPGDAVAADEALCELETDKVSVEVPAPGAGVLGEIVAKEGATVEVGALIATIEEGAAAKPREKTEEPAKAGPAAKGDGEATRAGAKPAARQVAAEAAPAARKLMAETGLEPSEVEGTGRDGRIMKEDVQKALRRREEAPAARAEAPAREAPAEKPVPRAPLPADDAAREKRVRMTRLRQTIARRLKEAQNTAAILTTYNEVDMTAVMETRSAFKDLFERKHGVKLGFMSFFVKACVHALRELPAVNAEIDGTDIVYKDYYHIGVAVGTPQGLVVPVVRNADAKSFAAIEKEIAELGLRARDGKLSMEDMQGGTFTISNGGIYGSLMSAPILNPPQSGILGMHKIQERPVVLGGQIVARPMMYLALSYDHRIVDGKEAVTFLVRVKESLEDPRRLLMDL